jgi:hypothetical protein
MSTFSHLKTETDTVSETLFSSYLEFRTKDKVHKPGDSDHELRVANFSFLLLLLLLLLGLFSLYVKSYHVMNAYS